MRAIDLSGRALAAPADVLSAGQPVLLPPGIVDLAPHDRVALWRRRVGRLAMAMRFSLPERFESRTCDCGCNGTYIVNVSLYLPTEPFEHYLTLYAGYEPEGKNGYWWACALRGLDPDAAAGTRPGLLRRWNLEKLCARNGFSFGSVR
jgi:hypothetical protein